ncbi:hypothetical protein BC835DRAFT_1405015 [Cytidiella melzeri]|nr:hypothetical protein BC835DRAFT_1405015 [Cytidiella melzeri]
MEYAAGTSWLQQQPVSDVHDARPTGIDGWKETTSSVAVGPPSAQPTMDLSDFGLDLGAASSSALSQSSNSYFPFSHGNYFLSGAPSSYSQPSYPNPQWPAPSVPHIPVSSYSSLNGATTVSQITGQTSQSSASPPQMMIDPALTTVSGHHANVPQYSHSQQYILPQAQSHTQYSYQHTSHPSTLSINPSFVHTTASHFQQQQQQPSQRQSSQHQTSPPPATLSPFLLHSPPNHNLLAASSIPPSSFYGSAHTSTPPPSLPPQSVGPTSEQLKERFLAGLRPLLKSDSFTGAGAVSQLTSYLSTYGMSKVDVATRLEILSKIRDNAPNHYFRAWAENGNAMSITKKWLTESGNAEPDSKESTATMPLLHIVDRLPMTVTTLRDSGIGKEIKRLSKSAPSSAVRDMSSNIANKWRALISSSGIQAPTGGKTMTEDSDGKSKKRKAEEPPTGSKGVPAAKKVPVPAAATTAVKVSTAKKPPLKTTGKETPKADSSFFSAPKQKPKLPDFKKAPISTKKEPDLNVAQPSSYDPFAEIVKTLRSRKDSPVVSTPPPGQTIVSKKQGKKKSVKWAPDGQLELIKIIERAVYDDDPADGMHATHSLRDLDRSEGAALIAHLFEQQIDYFEPPLLEMPPKLEVPERGKDSVERLAQEEREMTALGAAYMSDAHIPDSGAEPSSQIPEDQVDEGMQLMQVGPELEAYFGASAAVHEQPPMSVSVAELVGQLAAVGPPDVTMSSGAGPAALPFDNYDPATLAGFGPESLQQILQQAQALQNSSMFPPTALPGALPLHANSEPEWNSNGYPPYDNGEDTRWAEEGWRGGRGRGRGRGRGGGHGRGNRRRPCVFYQEGRCRYGDQCDFSHDTGLNY